MSVEEILAAKNAGNEHFKAKEYAEAIECYTVGVKLLPDLASDDESDDEGAAVAAASVPAEVLKQGAVLLCNRCAALLAEQKGIPALADAQRAASMDPTNWKAHWRTGLALMMMKPNIQRSELAMKAFERTLECPGLSPTDQTNAREAYNRAKYRREQGRDALDMPDMSNCCVC